ncbi:LysR substrate-binding domain-containing protein [Gulosibacter sp. 10]|uniref:LysR substrate-binding domain-containing protein n=1 Tax=Gulosibacter sp. 10 TaxID=1255570 RepID=UPI00097E8102|nr:LysR substrate-binding domain-containing protein [Gulosibacter sp. 10]SJM51366.1 putative LysR-family transcriptional regulator [Gulosibacter sp. 10]
MLEMKRLRLLWEFRTRGTIAAVAEALSYTPSAVSQQLNLLERETGFALLRKTGRNLELTAAGNRLADETERLLAGLERAEAALRRTVPEISGRLRIAVFQTAVLAIIPAALKRLRREHPGLRIEVVQFEPETALRETWARGFDLVVAEQYPEHAPRHFDGLDRIPLTTDSIHLALPLEGTADPAFDRVTGIEEAASLPWVVEPRGAASRHWAEQRCRRAGFDPDIRFETADMQAHVRLVESGNAVALLPNLVHMGEPRVRLLELEGAPHRDLFTAARRSSEENPAIETVRTVLADVAVDLMHW